MPQNLHICNTSLSWTCLWVEPAVHHGYAYSPAPVHHAVPIHHAVQSTMLLLFIMLLHIMAVLSTMLLSTTLAPVHHAPKADYYKPPSLRLDNPKLGAWRILNIPSMRLNLLYSIIMMEFKSLQRMFLAKTLTTAVLIDWRRLYKKHTFALQSQHIQPLRAVNTDGKWRELLLTEFKLNYETFNTNSKNWECTTNLVKPVPCTCLLWNKVSQKYLSQIPCLWRLWRIFPISIETFKLHLPVLAIMVHAETH